MSYVALGVAIVGAITAASAANQQAKTNRQIANNNAAVAEAAAGDAEKRGEQNAIEATRKARQLASAQRAAFSARGVDVSEGTAADIIEQTDFFGQSDAATARTNARKEAWNARAQKRGYEIESAANDPGRATTYSLLGSATGVANKWYGGR